MYAGVQQQMIANSPEFLPVLPPPPRSYSSSSSSRNEPVDCVKSEEVSCICCLVKEVYCLEGDYSRGFCPLVQ